MHKPLQFQSIEDEMERLKKDLQIEKEKHRRLALAEAGVCVHVSGGSKNF